MAGHLVAGFGRIVALAPADILTDVSGADDLLAAEEGAVAHMNEDHRDALRLYATTLLGLPDGDWRTTGADPDGIDLRAGPLRGRLAFPERVTTPGDLRRTLVDLAKEGARSPDPALKERIAPPRVLAAMTNRPPYRISPRLPSHRRSGPRAAVLGARQDAGPPAILRCPPSPGGDAPEPPPVDLSPDTVNAAAFDGSPIPEGRSAIVLKVQVLLDRAGSRRASSTA